MREIGQFTHVCVWGLGVRFKEKFESQELRKKYHVDLLCDNDASKWGKEFCGINCISPQKLAEISDVFVIVMLSNYESVCKQLDEMGIENVAYSKLEDNRNVRILRLNLSDFEDESRQKHYKYRVFVGSNVFEECRMLFAYHDDCQGILISDLDGTDKYLAIRDDNISALHEQLYRIMESILQMEEGLQKWLPKNVKIFFNEASNLSYECYRVIKKVGICCALRGTTWGALNLQDENTSADETEFAIYIENDGTGMEFLLGYISQCYARTIEKSASYLVNMGLKVCLLNVPECQELEYLSEEEKFCVRHHVNLNYIEKLSEQQEINQLEKIYGKKLCNEYKKGENAKGRNIKTIQGAVSYDLNPSEFTHTIYIMGQCIASQFDMPTSNTIVAYLQSFVDDICPNMFRVKSISIPLERYDLYEKVINSIDYRKNDLIIFISSHLKIEDNVHYVDLLDLFNEREHTRLFSDQCIHVNQEGSKRIAKLIHQKFIIPFVDVSENNALLLPGTVLEKVEEEYVRKYCEKYAAYKRSGKCGSIVMNCNPYTLGHDYLIQTARKEVDWLYIFVVEENHSFFSFLDRFQLVKENTKGYDNVIVLPSGEMVLSMRTFPSYFYKETMQNIQTDASVDLKIFCSRIAPFFNISVRFVGEEPLDNITHQYNEAMKERLPLCGIDLIEITRKCFESGVISASKVREYLNNGELEKVRRIVPVTTFNYLEKNMENWYGKKR